MINVTIFISHKIIISNHIRIRHKKIKKKHMTLETGKKKALFKYLLPNSSPQLSSCVAISRVNNDILYLNHNI